MSVELVTSCSESKDVTLWRVFVTASKGMEGLVGQEEDLVVGAGLVQEDG